MSTREQCDSCGFVWDDVIAAEIANLLTVTTDELCELLVTQEISSRFALSQSAGHHLNTVPIFVTSISVFEIGLLLLALK